MICPNCKKQIPDNSDICPACKTEINHKEQVSKEIKQRRWQRWFFYGVFSLMFLASISAVVFMYNERTRLLLDLSNLDKKAKVANEKLQANELTLKKVKKELEDKIIEAQNREEEIQRQTAEFKEAFEERQKLKKDLDNFKKNIKLVDANIYNLMVKLGKGISDRDLQKIPVALDYLIGEDDDGDKLPNSFEKAVGTNPNKMDSDDDSFSDYEELKGSFNPLGEGALSIDMNFAQEHIGDIFLQIDDLGEAWYVGRDGRRYFLGNPAHTFSYLFEEAEIEEAEEDGVDSGAKNQDNEDEDSISDSHPKLNDLMDLP